MRTTTMVLGFLVTLAAGCNNDPYEEKCMPIAAGACAQQCCKAHKESGELRDCAIDMYDGETLACGGGYACTADDFFAMECYDDPSEYSEYFDTGVTRSGPSWWRSQVASTPAPFWYAPVCIADAEAG